MRSVVICTAVVAGFSVVAGLSTVPVAAQEPIMAFVDVAVVDVAVVPMSRDRIRRGQTVLVRGHRIAAMGPTRRIRIPPTAVRVDGRGKFLIPGLWDMHAHLTLKGQEPDFVYPSYIAYGVTGIREMSLWNLDSMHQRRREVLAGTRVGPRSVGPGPVLTGNPPSPLAPEREILTPAEGRRVVDSLHAAGADFLKVYEGLSRDTYFAIAAEARRLGLPFAGHLTAVVTAAEAIDSGQRSFEHLWVLYQTGCIQQGRRKAGIPERIDTAACTALGTQMARGGTYYTPTLFIAGGYPDDVRPTVASFESGELRIGQVGRSSAGFARALLPLQRPHTRVLEATGLLHQAGAPLLVGTDDVGDFPGASVHVELTLLVEGAGLTPLQALQAATVHPAHYFGATDSLGTVAPGKLADLVLLNANPLEDIRHTTEIQAVMANGRYFDRAALDTLLVAAERVAYHPQAP